MTTITIQSTSPEVTFKLGQVIGKWLSGREGLIFLTGDIGAGKTAISKGIVFGYGYSGRVTSPTFALINRIKRKGLDTRSVIELLLSMNCMKLVLTRFRRVIIRFWSNGRKF